MAIPEISATYGKKEVRNYWWRHHLKGPKKVIVSSKAPGWWNWVETRILRSSRHHWKSNTDMLLTFTGRKTGKVFTVPVCYSRDGDTVICITKVGWWKNLSNGAPVTVCIKGEDLAGTAETTNDQEEVIDAMIRLIKISPIGAKFYGVEMTPAKEPVLESVKAAARFTYLIRITLTK